MLTSLAFIFLVGLAAAAICQQLKLPRIIGMLITGIILGPYVLDLLDPSILSISSELRQMALIIILLKAGLSLDLSDLKKVGRPAVLMSFVPASFEILAFFLFAPHILGIKPIEAAVMGAVLAAVSPAIVVPRMVRLMVQNYGTDKSIPQLILAGASCDDIFVIVLFSTFSNITQGGNAHLMDFVNIPVSILFGIVLGGITGYLLSLFFETAYASDKAKSGVRDRVPTNGTHDGGDLRDRPNPPSTPATVPSFLPASARAESGPSGARRPKPHPVQGSGPLRSYWKTNRKPSGYPSSRRLRRHDGFPPSRECSPAKSKVRRPASRAGAPRSENREKTRRLPSSSDRPPPDRPYRR